jgi:hypothetical protein
MRKRGGGHRSRITACGRPDLASVIDAWHTLPPDTRTAILAIVEVAQGR